MVRSSQPREVAAANLLRLQLLGAPRLFAADGTVVALGPRIAPLVTLIALGGAQLRAEAAALMYPQLDAAEGRRNLRQLIHKQAALLDQMIEHDGERMHLRAGLQVDALLSTAASLDRPPSLLGELRYDAMPQLQSWLDCERERRASAWLDALVGRAELDEREGRLADALASAQRIIREQPASEHSHRRVMRLHHLRGDRAAALAAYERCVVALAVEVSARPSSETDRLRQQIEDAMGLVVANAQTPLSLRRPPSMVGRDSEVSALLAALEMGCHALVVGDAGLGKTRLLSEFAQLRTVLSVQGRPGDGQRPHVVLSRLLRGLHEAGVRCGPRASSELARIAPELGPVATSKFESASFESAVEELLVAASAHVSAIVVDDLHFADLPSVEALLNFEASAAVPRLVFATRPAENDAGLALVRSGPGSAARLQEILLRPLPVRHIEELLGSIALPGLQPSTLALTLAAHTGGNPQFILETLKALFASGATGAADGRLPLPRSVGLLIDMRLKQLSAPAIKLARIAAIAGSDFSAALAASVLQCDALDMADAWTELEAAAVLVDQRFAHDLVYEITLAGVPAAIARSLHGAVAEALNKATAAPAREASHWLAAGESERALPLFLATAAEAKRTEHNHEAAQHYDTAAAIQAGIGDKKAEVESLLALCDCLIDLPGSARLDHAMERLFDRLEDGNPARARAFELRSRICASRLEREAALTYAQQALTLSVAANDAATTFDSRLAATQAFFMLERMVEGAASLASARKFAESDATPLQRLNYFQAVAWLVLKEERLEESHALWKKVEAAAIEHRSPAATATALNYLTLCEGGMGDFVKAAATAEHWRQFLLDHGLFGQHQSYIDLNLAYIYQQLGHYQSVLDSLGRAEALHVPDVGSLHARYANVFLTLGQLARVRQHLDAMARIEPLSSGMRLTLMLLTLRLDRTVGRPLANVDEVLAQAERIAKASGTALQRIRWLLAHAEFLDGEPALEAARQAVDLAASKSMHGCCIGAHTRLAAALSRRGDRANALTSVRVALALSDTYRSEFVYGAEVGQVACEVMALCGENTDVVLRSTVDWIQQTAAHHVPAEFRDSFMNRNPVNRSLLAAATRLGSARGKSVLHRLSPPQR